MTTLFNKSRPALRSGYLLLATVNLLFTGSLLFIGSLLVTGTAAIAAEAAPVAKMPQTPIAHLPQVLTAANAKAGSAGDHYQPLPEQSIVMPAISTWQDANQRVKDIGGWMFYASEADAGDDLSKKPSEQPAKHHSKHHHHPKTSTPVKDQP